MGCDHSEGRSTGHSEDVRTVREDLLGAAVRWAEPRIAIQGFIPG